MQTLESVWHPACRLTHQCSQSGESVLRWAVRNQRHAPKQLRGAVLLFQLTFDVTSILSCVLCSISAQHKCKPHTAGFKGRKKQTQLKTDNKEVSKYSPVANLKLCKVLCLCKCNHRMTPCSQKHVNSTLNSLSRKVCFFSVERNRWKSLLSNTIAWNLAKNWLQAF